MCLTLANAATIHHHTDPTGTTGSSARGYKSTAHHAGHLTPGDQWRPLPDQPPRTVTDIHRHHGVIVLEVLNDPADQEHNDRLEWLGLDDAAEFDPDGFDAEAVTRALSFAR